MSQIGDNKQSYGHETLTKIGHIIKLDEKKNPNYIRMNNMIK
jgi:hypothetical protein